MHIFGVPGGSGSAIQAAVAAKQGERSAREATRAGVAGEKTTGKILFELFKNDPTVYVFHSVEVPDERGGTDIDHVIVRGNRIVCIDSKRWQPGFYWTPPGKFAVSRRHLKTKFEAADKRSIPLAITRLHQALPKEELYISGAIVVHTATGEHPKLWALRTPDRIRNKNGEKQTGERIPFLNALTLGPWLRRELRCPLPVSAPSKHTLKLLHSKLYIPKNS